MLLNNTLCAILVCAPAYADVFSMEGDRYLEVRNENGIVLTSAYPKARIVGQVRVQQRIVERHEVFYLGEACDVASPWLGAGIWQWTNAGIILEFDSGAVFTFRYELETLDGEMLNCNGF